MNSFKAKKTTFTSFFKQLNTTFISLTAIILLSTTSCNTETSRSDYETAASDPVFLHRAMQQLTDVMVYNIFSPPVASRIYAYASVAGYEAMAAGDSAYISLAGQINGLTAVPQPEAGKVYCYPMASVQAFLKVGKALTFSEEEMEVFLGGLQEEMDSLGVPKDVAANSIAYGDAVAKHILAFASGDNYAQTRTAPKYTITEDLGRWKPTPPDYMEAVEPSWGKIRPFALDSAGQFAPPPPPVFSLEPSSQFYKEMLEVYNIRKSLDSNQLGIAKFWDCNPYVSTHVGHVMFATKKITPGGHWINIASIAAKKANANFMRTAQTYALTALALADGFISCWDEKFRSNLVRPETIINKTIDEDWRPLLQTPPFPEYTSGHSVISSAAAVALTNLYGDSFDFLDDSEIPYGLPSRSFKSFYEASDEAADSRMYGGIHYRSACKMGVSQGRQVGEWVVSRIKFQ